MDEYVGFRREMMSWGKQAEGKWVQARLMSAVGNRQAVWIALVALVLVVGFDLQVLRNHQFNPHAFILQKDPDVPDGQDWGIGYDAQWYYAIARDPLGAAGELDQPAYRYQRIVYPITARILALGREAWLPWAMLAVNLGAATAVSVSLGLFLIHRKASPWFSLVLILSLGYLFALRVDLLEPLALALAVGGWLAYEHGRPVTAVILFALGALTKEFVLVFPAALVAWEVLKGRYRWALAIASGSFLPYLAWWLFLTSRLGLTEKAIAQSRLSWPPFSGIQVLTDPTSRWLIILWVLIPATLGALAAAWELVSARKDLKGPEALLVLANVVLIATLPQLTWIDPLAVLRLGTGLLAALILWAGSRQPRLLPYLAGLYLPSGLILALVPGMV